MKLDRSLYWGAMDRALDYDHAPCPKCGAIDLASASCRCWDNGEPCRLRGLAWDANGSFVQPLKEMSGADER